MTDVIKILKFNETYLKLDCEPSVAYELNDHFSFYVDGHKFHPKFKLGIWSGKINMLNLRNGQMYHGLYDDIVEFAKSRGYKIELQDSPAFGLPSAESNILPEDVVDFVKSLNLHSNNTPIDVRDYQFQAVYRALKHYRRTIISPTGSGKSLIAFLISKWIVDNVGRVLIIVPSTQLCYQMQGDFEDYCSHNDYDVLKNTHIIMAGKDKNVNREIVISTWQSLSQSRVSSEWINGFDCVITDETHGAAAKELTNIIEKASSVKYRFGLTGSLGKSKTNQMVIKGLFGPVIKVASSRQLIDEGHLSDIKIKCLLLNYSKDTRSLFSGKQDYNKEIDFLISHDRRNKFIRNLALSLEGNTLILFTRVEGHGEILYNLIKDKSGERIVHYIHGGVESEERNDVRNIVEKANNAIIVASTGVFAVGVNIKRLHNIIFAHPSKSAIKIIQSIGRGLRKAQDKSHVELYDIADRLNKSKTKSNHTYRHLIERLKLYTEEEFDYKIVEVEIE